MIPGARLVILGRQGAGKGTQCVRLSRHYVVPHISTGDMLRAAVREQTQLGIEAKEIMDSGGLVGDDIMIGLVAERLKRADAETRGYILDGFPRTVVQADALDDIAGDSRSRGDRPLRRPPGRAPTHHGPAGVPRLRHQLHRHRHRAAAVDLRGVRRRRHAAGRRPPRRRQPPPRPVRDADGAADRALQRRRPARRVDGVGTPDQVFRRLTDAITGAKS